MAMVSGDKHFIAENVYVIDPGPYPIDTEFTRDIKKASEIANHQNLL